MELWESRTESDERSEHRTSARTSKLSKSNVQIWYFVTLYEHLYQEKVECFCLRTNTAAVKKLLIDTAPQSHHTNQHSVKQFSNMKTWSDTRLFDFEINVSAINEPIRGTRTSNSVHVRVEVLCAWVAPRYSSSRQEAVASDINHSTPTLNEQRVRSETTRDAQLSVKECARWSMHCVQCSLFRVFASISRCWTLLLQCLLPHTVWYTEHLLSARVELRIRSAFPMSKLECGTATYGPQVRHTAAPQLWAICAADITTVRNNYQSWCEHNTAPL